MSDKDDKPFSETAAEMMQNFVEGDDAPSGDDTLTASDDTLAGGDDSLPSGDDTLASVEGDDAPSGDDTLTASDDTLAGGDDSLPSGDDTLASVEGDDAASNDVAAPASMSDADKEQFNKLTPDMKAWVNQREAQRDQGYTRKMQEVAGLRNDYEPVQAMFEPYRKEMHSAGYTPESYIRELVNLDMQAQADPLTYVVNAVQKLKVNPAHIAAKLGIKVEEDFFGSGDPVPPIPEAKPARQLPSSDQINQNMELNRYRQQEEAQYAAQIDQFAATKNEDGTLRYPHFNLLATEMAKLPVDRVGLDAAYHHVAQRYGLIATPSHPGAQAPQVTPQAMADPAPAGLQGDVVADAKAKVAKAMKANRVAPSEPAQPTPPPDTSQMTTAELLEHNMSQVGQDG